MRNVIALLFLVVFGVKTNAIGLSGGTYKVGPSETYTSFSDVKTALNDGVLGPVVFLLDSTQTWTEKVEFISVSGASETNTVTLRGAGVFSKTELIGNGNSASNYIFKINGASHFRFQNLNLKTSNIDYGSAISIEGTCNNVIIENCDFEAVVSPSLNPNLALIQGNSSTILDQLIIRNNNFTNGSCGVYLNNFTQNQSTSIEIYNNNLLNQPWHAIALTRYANISVRNNMIKNPGYTGIYVVDSDQNCHINSNKIINSSKVGISLLNHNSQASVGDLNLYNNIISEPLLDGINIAQGKHYKIIHNTVKCSQATQLSNAIRLTEIDASLIMNNIFSNPNGGELINLVDISGTVNFDYNDLGHNGQYVAVTSITSPAQDTYISFSDWQATQDANSITLIPIFEDASTLKLSCESKILMQSCQNLSSPFDYDMDSVLRDAVCMMGAIEKKYNNLSFTSVGGTATVLADSCKDGLVYLLADVSSSQVLDTIGIDTLTAGNNGEFLFTNLANEEYFIKVIPNRTTYPNWLPTYAGGIQEWDISFQLGKDICNELRIHIPIDTTLALTGTPIGKISGIIAFDGTNKKTDPIPGLDIVLDKIPPTKSVMATTTNSLGEYTFVGLPEGQYQVMIDYPGIGKDTLHTVNVNSSNTNLINLDYCVDTTDNILICGVAENVFINEVKNTIPIKAFPNPFENNLRIELPNDINNYTIKVIDAVGRQQSFDIEQNSNLVELIFNSRMPKGIYFIQVTTYNETGTYPILKK